MQGLGSYALAARRQRGAPRARALRRRARRARGGLRADRARRGLGPGAGRDARRAPRLDLAAQRPQDLHLERRDRGLLHAARAQLGRPGRARRADHVPRPGRRAGSPCGASRSWRRTRSASVELDGVELDDEHRIGDEGAGLGPGPARARPLPHRRRRGGQRLRAARARRVARAPQGARAIRPAAVRLPGPALRPGRDGHAPARGRAPRARGCPGRRCRRPGPGRGGARQALRHGERLVDLRPRRPAPRRPGRPARATPSSASSARCARCASTRAPARCRSWSWPRS